MKWLWAGLIAAVITMVEQWGSWWWQIAGIPLPLVGWAMYILCRWLDRQWWPWLGLVVGIVSDICGIGFMGQYSLWWWLSMSGAWWLDGRLDENSRGRWVVMASYIAVVVGLLPVYEAAWLGLWPSPNLILLCGMKMMYVVLIGWPLAWLGRQKKKSIAEP